MARESGTIVVAVGGNSLIVDQDHVSVQDQQRAATESMKHIAEMVAAGWRVVATHGNGPQVGFLLRRAELASGELPTLPLDVLVADTQGAIGYMFSTALRAEFGARGIQKDVVALVTHSVVDPDDPAFAAPSKPVGSFMSEAEAAAHAAEDGWNVVEDSRRGWRRVVASPLPRRILEVDAVRALVEKDFTVIAAGGGGIPVVAQDGGYRGVEAVIDKDLATALLAKELGAGTMLISTAVDAVAVGFGTSQQRWLATVHAAELREHLAHGEFGAGSMAPKVKAAVDFVEQGGDRAVITSPQLMMEALAGTAGTLVLP